MSKEAEFAMHKIVVGKMEDGVLTWGGGGAEADLKKRGTK